MANRYGSGMSPDEIKSMSRSIIGDDDRLPEPEGDKAARLRESPDDGDPNVATPSYCPYCKADIRHIYPAKGNTGEAGSGTGGGINGPA